MKLPDTKSEIVFNMALEKILLYGPPKIGKTQLVNALFQQLGVKGLFIATERGHSKINAYVQDVNSWIEFKDTIKAVRESKEFQTVAIDTTSVLWQLFIRDWCQAKGIDYENSGKEWGFGKGLVVSVREFTQEFIQLQNVGKGVIFITHESRWEEDFDGKERSFFGPDLPYDKNSLIKATICGLVDSIIYMTMGTSIDGGALHTGVRMLRTAPAAKGEYLAGARFNWTDPITLINDDPDGSAKRWANAYRLAQKTQMEKPAEVKKP